MRAALGAACASTAAEAQTVRGRILDQAGAAISGVTIILLDSMDVEVTRLRTDAAGGYTIEAPGPGSYRLRSIRVGYEPWTSAVLQLASGQVLDLTPQAEEVVQLPAMTVEAEAPTTRLRQFNARRAAGFGRFISRDEFEVFQPLQTTDVLRRMSGARLARMSDGTYRVVSARAGRTCAMSVFLDGIPLAGTVDPNTIVPIQDLEAVEVYRGPSEIPPELNVRNSSCGVVVFWTRPPEIPKRDAPPPQPPKPRSGVWLGGGVGTGRGITCRFAQGSCDSSIDGGFAGFLQVGFAVSRHVLAGVEGTSWTQGRSDAVVQALTASALVFTSPRFFLQLGAGVMRYNEDEFGDPLVTATRLGFVLGLGWDTMRLHRVGAGPFLKGFLAVRGGASTADTVVDDGFRMGLLQAGFQLKWN